MSVELDLSLSLLLLKSCIYQYCCSLACVAAADEILNTTLKSRAEFIL